MLIGWLCYGVNLQIGHIFGHRIFLSGLVQLAKRDVSAEVHLRF